MATLVKVKGIFDPQTADKCAREKQNVKSPNIGLNPVGKPFPTKVVRANQKSSGGRK